jgi:hypothetical protein
MTPHYMHYNFARVHQTLRVTPAMEAGISDHVWSLEEIVALIDLSSLRPCVCLNNSANLMSSF